MHVARTFEPRDAAQALAEINRIRFGTLVTRAAGFDATPIPWVAERGADGRILLWGHLARHNPQVAALATAPEALVAFTGANGYISPRWLPTPHSAPTWNYVAVHATGRCHLLDNAGTGLAVDKLVSAVEGGRAAPWSAAELGARREPLMGRIVGVQVAVERWQAKFKLGQNESAADLAAMLGALEREGAGALAARMREACYGAA